MRATETSQVAGSESDTPLQAPTPSNPASLKRFSSTAFSVSTSSTWMARSSMPASRNACWAYNGQIQGKGGGMSVYLQQYFPKEHPLPKTNLLEAVVLGQPIGIGQEDVGLVLWVAVGQGKRLVPAVPADVEINQALGVVGLGQHLSRRLRLVQLGQPVTDAAEQRRFRLQEGGGGYVRLAQELLCPTSKHTSLVLRALSMRRWCMPFSPMTSTACMCSPASSRMSMTS